MKLCPYAEAEDVYPDEMAQFWGGTVEEFKGWKTAYIHWRKIALEERAYWQKKVEDLQNTNKVNQK